MRSVPSTSRTAYDKRLGAALGGGPLLGGMIVHHGLGASRLWFLAFYAIAIAAYLVDRFLVRPRRRIVKPDLRRPVGG